MKARVTYRARNGVVAIAEARIDEYDGRYCATNLALWGCGKYSATPEGAVRMLVQDMASIINIEVTD